MKPYSIHQRASFFNESFPHLNPLHVDTVASKPFIVGYWFLGGGNISQFYGSYTTEYLQRIQSIFPDAGKVIHLFSGSMPASPDYTRVGQDPTGQYKSDLEIDAEQLSSHLKFNPDLIYADPPYSVEDAEHYKIGLVDRRKVVSECAQVLQPGGYLVWLDTALPLFQNKEINMVGAINYIRSTGNRYRCITLFRKPMR